MICKPFYKIFAVDVALYGEIKILLIVYYYCKILTTSILEHEVAQILSQICPKQCADSTVLKEWFN